jgi:hypothetical protein
MYMIDSFHAKFSRGKFYVFYITQLVDIRPTSTTRLTLHRLPDTPGVCTYRTSSDITITTYYTCVTSFQDI